MFAHSISLTTRKGGPWTRISNYAHLAPDGTYLVLLGAPPKPLLPWSGAGKPWVLIFY